MRVAAENRLAPVRITGEEDYHLVNGLRGREGFIAGVDLRRNRYTVLIDDELWIIAPQHVLVLGPPNRAAVMGDCLDDDSLVSLSYRNQRCVGRVVAFSGKWDPEVQHWLDVIAEDGTEMGRVVWDGLAGLNPLGVELEDDDWEAFVVRLRSGDLTFSDIGACTSES